MVPKKAKNRVIPKIRVIVRLMLCSNGSWSTYVFFSVQNEKIEISILIGAVLAIFTHDYCLYK